MSQFDPSGHLEQVVWLFLGSPHYYTPATDTVAPLAFLLLVDRYSLLISFFTPISTSAPRMVLFLSLLNQSLTKGNLPQFFEVEAFLCYEGLFEDFQPVFAVHHRTETASDNTLVAVFILLQMYRCKWCICHNHDILILRLENLLIWSMSVCAGNNISSMHTYTFYIFSWKSSLKSSKKGAAMYRSFQSNGFSINPTHWLWQARLTVWNYFIISSLHCRHVNHEINVLKSLIS